MKLELGEEARAGARRGRHEIRSQLTDRSRGGVPLPASQANHAAAALGADVSDVRVHQHPDHQRLAADAGLAAVTVGRDVYMGRAAISAPASIRDAILAHELVHATQQRRAAAESPRPERLLTHGSAVEEREANEVAPHVFAAMARGGAPTRRSLNHGILPAPLGLYGCSEDAVQKMKNRKHELEDVTKQGSGKSFGEVGAAYTEIVDLEHDLAVKETGRGLYKGGKSTDTSSAKATDCTLIVFQILRDTFNQQGRSAEWAKVEKKYHANTKNRGGQAGHGSGVDLQAALQSELGWKGIYWAPDPTFAYKDEDVSRVKGSEAKYSSDIAKSKGTYYKGFGKKKGYPGVRVDELVVGYAPEPGSTTTADSTGLNKLKRLPFGVMSAHGGYHMTLITSGKVTEVHWESPSTTPDVITRENLESWAIGPRSGIHYFASGAIVAPAEDVDAAFR
ncbi:MULTISPECIES: eCIS core domain-containing protein [Rhodococcus]|uniref:eCIS core domain-containing protein n=1 Tax=Rhodococcus TaxID=1827 RepID=UPI0019178B20|nr:MULTISPECIES: DUF4157 domain-containing protein [Rhodococcus]UOT08363.1 DUF4157 domain-containing protein [Rhodococcus opacus]